MSNTQQFTKLVRDQTANPRAVDLALLRSELQAGGYDASLADIEWAWDRYSDEASAQWLATDAQYEAADHVEILRRYLKEQS